MSVAYISAMMFATNAIKRNKKLNPSTVFVCHVLIIWGMKQMVNKTVAIQPSI
jgi:hypothetical protein